MQSLLHHLQQISCYALPSETRMHSKFGNLYNKLSCGEYDVCHHLQPHDVTNCTDTCIMQKHCELYLIRCCVHDKVKECVPALDLLVQHACNNNVRR